MTKQEQQTEIKRLASLLAYSKYLANCLSYDFANKELPLKVATSHIRMALEIVQAVEGDLNED